MEQGKTETIVLQMFTEQEPGAPQKKKNITNWQFI